MHDPAANKALIRRFYDEAINRHDAAAAAAFYAVDAKNHGHTVGRAGMQRVFEMLFATFEGFHYRLDEATAEEDRVVCRMTMSGTHRGRPTTPQAFGGMLDAVAPTGIAVTVLQFHSFRIRNGEITEHAAVRDDLGMLKQLGLIAAPAATRG